MDRLSHMTICIQNMVHMNTILSHNTRNTTVHMTVSHNTVQFPLLSTESKYIVRCKLTSQVFYEYVVKGALSYGRGHRTRLFWLWLRYGLAVSDSNG